jgi:hypothetical protein
VFDSSPAGFILLFVSFLQTLLRLSDLSSPFIQVKCVHTQ